MGTRGGGRGNPVFGSPRPSPPSCRLCEPIRKKPRLALFPKRGPSKGPQRWCPPNSQAQVACLTVPTHIPAHPTTRWTARSLPGLRLPLPAPPQARRAPGCVRRWRAPLSAPAGCRGPDNANRDPLPRPFPRPAGPGIWRPHTNHVYSRQRPGPSASTRALSSLPQCRVG